MENNYLYNTISEMINKGMDLRAITNEILEGVNGTEQYEVTTEL